MNEIKPLNWTPKPGVGFTVVRRDDGGMTLTFTDLSDATLNEWREFAMEHLLGVDRRTRNLYDIRARQGDSRKGDPHGSGSEQRSLRTQYPCGGRRCG